MRMRYYCPTHDCILDEDDVYVADEESETTGVFTIRCKADDAVVEMDLECNDEDEDE